MRILYLTNGFPFPLTTGYLRHYYLVRELAKRHAVTLVSLAADDFLPEHAEALRPFTEEVHAFRLERRPRGGLHRLLRDFRLALQTDPAVHQMARAVEKLHRRNKFDAVLLSGKQTLPALRGVPGLPVVADVCDAASVRVSLRQRHVAWWRRPRLRLAASLMRRAERRIVQSAQCSLFASPRDRDAVLGTRRAEGIVLPNGVDLAYWRRTNRELGTRDVIFTGNMRYAPNADAALLLTERIFPLVKRAVPEARLLLVGRDPLPALQQAAQRCDGATVTGYVDDVRPHLEGAAVFAAPLRFGAGIQNKVLEALALELPVVASSLAAAGLCTVDGERPPVHVADEIEQSAAAIVEALRRGPAPCTAAREYVARNFSWERSGERLEQALLAAAGETRAAVPSSPVVAAPAVS